MDTLDTFKTSFYALLDTLPYEIVQGSQTIFTQLPKITYTVASNTPRLNLDGKILAQDVEVKLDIWAETSTQASTMLQNVEQLLRNNGHRLTFNADVPNPEDIVHISTRFTTYVL